MNKNKLLAGFLVMIALFLGFSGALFANSISYKRDGFLRLYHSHLGDFLEIQYERDGRVLPGAMEKINQFMRTRDSGEVREMDINLIRLLDHLQDHFEADTVEVICGYRSETYNKNLKEAGRNVAENSNHIRGIAADIHLDEIREETLMKYARKLGFGGVGYYPNLMMVHVDLGWKHNWDEGTFANRTDIGIFNKSNSSQIRSNKVFYDDKDLVKLSLQNFSSKPLKIEVEHFYRGQWQVGKNLDVAIPEGKSLDITASLVPVGKNRLKFSWADGSWQNSNEFYLKRK
ncbi:DUF882 domain-containing protein [bacterium]|nr:DUF882 domain-containing protein [bacterium]